MLINDAQLGRFRAGERIIRGSSRGAGPVSGLLVLRTRESYGTVVAIVPEGRKLSYRQRIGSRRGCRLNHRDRGGYKLQEELIITRHMNAAENKRAVSKDWLIIQLVFIAIETNRQTDIICRSFFQSQQSMIFETDGRYSSMNRFDEIK